MATIVPHSDSFGDALARAGESILRRTANVLLRIADYEFGATRLESSATPGLEGLVAQTTQLVVIAHRDDVDAAPTELCDGVELLIDGVRHRIGRRLDRDELRQVDFTLEPLQ
jgi:hypothetical protein